MKLLVFTKEDGPEMRAAIERGKEVEEIDKEVEFLDTEHADSIARVELYDIYSTPSFVAIRDDGSEIQTWQGYIPPKGEIILHLGG